MRLRGKRIIVTGGGQGIGAGTVHAFVGEGATVTSFSRDKDRGRIVAEDATAAGPGTATFRQVDVGDRSQVDEAFDEAVTRMGGLDVLVHVAGIHSLVPLHDVPQDVLDEMFRVNVYGTMYCNAAAYRTMVKAGGGAIVNFGSESGVKALTDNGVYGATKGAVHMWTRCVAKDWGPHGIRVNAVLPYVVTPMYAQYRASLSPAQLALHDKQTAEQIPLGGKFGDVAEDLAPVLVFLASDDSRFITGQMIPVDGGLLPVR
jgi:NAD(P)-dependent dehydrogenase (short-subunit alcohol dehydrogenase family)